MKLKLEIDFDETAYRPETVGEALVYAVGTVYRMQNSSEPFQVRQPAERITDFSGKKIGSWHITDGFQTDGTEPGNGRNEPVVQSPYERIRELELEVDRLRHNGGV